MPQTPKLEFCTMTATQYAYFVYILASQPYGTLYIGVTNDIHHRTAQHRQGIGSKFTKKYGVHQLVWVEEYADIEETI